MKKKILIFSTAYYPFVGGAEIAVKEITDRISDVEFHMLTAKMDKKLPQREKIGNVTIFRIGIGNPIIDKLLLSFSGHRMARKLQKQNDYDAVWAIMASYGGLAASKFKRVNSQIPFLLTLQEGDSQEHIQQRTKFIKNQFRNIFKRADKIQCISNYLADWAKSLGAQCPIEVIPNGVGVKNLTQKISDKELNNLKEKLGKRDDKFIITTSRLTLKNGIDDLIKSLIYLPENIKLLIAGIGEDKLKLKKIVKERGLEKRVNFLGFVENKEIAKYLKISDIFIRPSLSEGLGISFLEAMATKTPVIATPVGGIPDFLKDRETGLFCKVKDSESIAEQVKVFLSNEKLREKIIENAYKMILQKYDWDIIAQKMKKIL